MNDEVTIYAGEQRITGDQLKASYNAPLTLGHLHDTALAQLIAKANEEGDYLDPNSVMVTVRVEARSL